jgi:hypothetical protein
MPGLVDRTLRGQNWQQNLSDISSIDIGSRFRTFIGGFGQNLKVTTKQGEEATFQVWKGQALGAAIREAMGKDGN